ncbi:MAG: hypothetical protein AUI91_09110 [Acidobacteria bacterium 13_1_40CM_3_56_11]|nr:MAG: hypothetical protein AUI91_09110 [Acidobacteria bacterium 13_1_40CM_3_56_11]
MNEQVTIKTGFKKLSDSQALAIAGAVINGVFVDKAIAAAPPFDETTLQTAVDDLTGAIAAQAQAGGGTAVTAVKNKSVACWMVCCVGSRNTFRRTLTMTCSSC